MSVVDFVNPGLDLSQIVENTALVLGDTALAEVCDLMFAQFERKS
jgi:hypothetical protein